MDSTVGVQSGRGRRLFWLSCGVLILVFCSVAKTEIAFLFAAVVTAMIALTERWRGSLVQVVSLPFFLLLALGTFSALLNNNALLPVARDFWFFSTPIVYLACGTSLFIAIRPQFVLLRVIVFSGILLSALFLVQWVVGGGAALTRTQARLDIGFGYFITAPALVLCLFDNKYSLGIFRKRAPRLGAAFFLFVVMLVTQSRTIISAALILSILLRFNQVSARVLLSLMTALSIIFIFLASPLFSLVVPYSEFRSLGALPSFLSEIVVYPYTEFHDINERYRSFEASHVYDAFLQGNPFQIAFGQGFGKEVDLGLALFLGDQPHREIGVFHNGFSYILLKTGFIGLASFFLFNFLTLAKGIELRKASGLYAKFWGNVLIAQSFIWLYSTTVIRGPLNGGDSAAVGLILTSIAYSHRTSLSQIRRKLTGWVGSTAV